MTKVAANNLRVKTERVQSIPNRVNGGMHLSPQEIMSAYNL